MRIVVIGGGVAGLGTALACARDGHEVVILERDDTPMPADPDAAFAWQRTGSPQVRHSHAFLARLRNLLRDRAPDVLDALLAAGATEMRFADPLPETLTDRSAQPGDDELVAIACRRTTFEWVLRRLVLAEPGVELRHGVAAHALDAVPGAAPGSVPRVTGVDGIAADLVVDARGPRSSSDDWLAAIGVAPVAEELVESGIVYFSRFYRASDSPERPDTLAIAAADLGYLKFAIFIGDNDTFSVTFAIDRDDEVLRRRLAEPDAFEAVAGAIPGIAPWRVEGAAVPINDVQVMAGLRNRYRPFVGAEGAPIVHGFVAVGDAAVCTNPLYGRGCTLAMVHAFGLADALRAHGDDLDAMHRAFASYTEREVVPWFRSAVTQDEQSRAMRDAAEGDLASDDPRAFMRAVFRDGFWPAVRTSPVVFRTFVRVLNLLVPPETLMQDPAVVAAVLEAYQDRENRPTLADSGPERDELLARIA